MSDETTAPTPETAPGADGTPSLAAAGDTSHDAVPRLEVDETVPPRPEEEIADAVRGTDATPPRPGDA